MALRAMQFVLSGAVGGPVASKGGPAYETPLRR